MKLLFFPLICVLLAAFLKAIYSLKKRDALLTPILAWLVGLGFFLLAPLTIIVLNNGYQAPNFYDVDSRHADVNLSLLESIPPFFMIWSALFLSFVTVILFLPKLDKGWQRREVFLNDGALKRAIYLSVGLMVLDWVITVYLVGGVSVSSSLLRKSHLSGALPCLTGCLLLVVWKKENGHCSGIECTGIRADFQRLELPSSSSCGDCRTERGVQGFRFGEQDCDGPNGLLRR